MKKWSGFRPVLVYVIIRMWERKTAHCLPAYLCQSVFAITGGPGAGGQQIKKLLKNRIHKKKDPVTKKEKARFDLWKDQLPKGILTFLLLTLCFYVPFIIHESGSQRSRSGRPSFIHQLGVNRYIYPWVFYLFLAEEETSERTSIDILWAFSFSVLSRRYPQFSWITALFFK